MAAAFHHRQGAHGETSTAVVAYSGLERLECFPLDHYQKTVVAFFETSFCVWGRD